MIVAPSVTGRSGDPGWVGWMRRWTEIDPAAAISAVDAHAARRGALGIVTGGGGVGRHRRRDGDQLRQTRGQGSLLGSGGVDRLAERRIEAVTMACQHEVDARRGESAPDVGGGAEVADAQSVAERQRSVEVRRMMHHGDVQILGAQVVAGDDVEDVGSGRRVMRDAPVGEDRAADRVRVDGVEGNEDDVESRGGAEPCRRRRREIAHHVDSTGEGVLLGIVAGAVQAEERNAARPQVVVSVDGDDGVAEPGFVEDAVQMREALHTRADRRPTRRPRCRRCAPRPAVRRAAAPIARDRPRARSARANRSVISVDAKSRSFTPRRASVRTSRARDAGGCTTPSRSTKKWVSVMCTIEAMCTGVVAGGSVADRRLDESGCTPRTLTTVGMA